MATIYTGLEAAWYVPGIYINVDLGRGTPSAAALTRKLLIIGNKLTDSEFYADGSEISDGYKPFFEIKPKAHEEDPDVWGTTTADGDLVEVPDLRRAGLYFGHGSELYLMAKAAFTANPSIALYAYVQPQEGGGYSTLTCTFSEPVPEVERKDGAITITVLGYKCTVRVKKNDSFCDIKANVAKAFNAQLKDLPFYAECCGSESSSSSCIADTADVVFSAKTLGSVWNEVKFTIDTGETGIVAEMPEDGPGTVVSGTTSVVSGTPSLSSSAFAEASVLYNERFHYIAIPYNNEGNIGALSEFVSKQAYPEVGLRQQGLFGNTATEFDETSIKDDCFDPRVQCVWAPGNYYFPGQLAAAVASVRQKWEGSDPACNLCYKPLPGMPKTLDANLATPVENNGAIAGGITPLVPYQGNMVILRSVTCAVDRDINPVLDTGKVTVSDFLADDIEIKMLARYKGFKLSPDTDMPLPSRVTTPSGIKKSLIEWLRSAEARGIITRVTELAPQVLVEIDEDVPGRVNFEIPEDVVDIFAVGAGNIVQIG